MAEPKAITKEQHVIMSAICQNLLNSNVPKITVEQLLELHSQIENFYSIDIENQKELVLDTASLFALTSWTIASLVMDLEADIIETTIN